MKLIMKESARRLVTVCVLTLATLTSSAMAAEKVDVVASFSILGDLTQQIGGERVRVHTLVGPNGDAHVYQPTPADAKTIAQARLVIVNGFGFEGWISRLVTSSGYRGKVVIASNGIKTLERAPSEDKEAEHHDHEGAVDPHAWQDLSNALKYV
jgi:zinc/manganese transport system substrate-binding protein